MPQGLQAPISTEFQTEDELFLAAKALVDAAAFCRMARDEQPMTDSQRERLTRAVYDDPGLTLDLFRGSICSLQ